jgi:hypothetical protein
MRPTLGYRGLTTRWFIQFGHVATRPPLAALRHTSLWELEHYQCDPTVSGSRWNPVPKKATRVDRGMRFLGPHRAYNPAKKHEITNTKA